MRPLQRFYGQVDLRPHGYLGALVRAQAPIQHSRDGIIAPTSPRHRVRITEFLLPH